MSYMAELNAMYENIEKEFERKIVLRQYYMDAMPEIIDLAKKSLNVWADIYPFDWKFNKNERSLWNSIRMKPMVMYPEFPVFNRFVDFGNPYLRIALEADGRTFHDRDKDTERDITLLRAGWKTFRVSYEENVHVFDELSEIVAMLTSGHEGDADDALENWMLNTSDGVVDAISYFYFMNPDKQNSRRKCLPRYHDLAEETLKTHRLVKFSLPEITT